MKFQFRILNHNLLCNIKQIVILNNNSFNKQIISKCNKILKKVKIKFNLNNKYRFLNNLNNINNKLIKFKNNNNKLNQFNNSILVLSKFNNIKLRKINNSNNSNIISKEF